jgi:3'(2'), 5'-bisphosphate nucleotidase
LDGTQEFTTGGKDFTINVALVQNGTAVLGLVVAPAHNLAYWAMRGKGAFRATVQSGKLIDISPIRVTKARDPIVMLSRSRSDTPEVRPFLADLGNPPTEQLGSSLKSCRIAEGLATHYPCFGDTYEWDTAASQCVLEEAGGWLRPIGGGQLAYGKSFGRRPFLNPGFVASAY